MTQLSARHELFVRKVIEAAKTGRSQGWAYLQSGYDCTPAAADMASSRLIKTDKIQARLAELSAPATRKTRVTVESLLAQLEATVAGVTEAKQFGAVKGSVALIGKLTGLLRERLEVGAVGTFDGIVTMLDAIERMVSDFDSPQVQLGGPHELLACLDEMREALVDYLANRAEDVGQEPARLEDHGAAGVMARSGMTQNTVPSPAAPSLIFGWGTHNIFCEFFYEFFRWSRLQPPHRGR
jgi:hypothetical protein